MESLASDNRIKLLEEENAKLKERNEKLKKELKKSRAYNKHLKDEALIRHRDLEKLKNRK